MLAAVFDSDEDGLRLGDDEVTMMEIDTSGGGWQWRWQAMAGIII